MLRNLEKLPNLEDLTKLSLREIALQDEGLEALLQLPLGSVTTLDLSGNGISPRGLRALLTCDELSGLRSLTLSENPIGRSADQRFSEQDLPTLEALALENNQYQSESLWSAAAPWLRQLEHLELSYTGLDGPELQKLLQALRGGVLQSLCLSRNLLGSEGLSALGANASPGPLHTLLLQGCGLTDDSLSALIECPYLGQLRVLDLSGNELSDEGVIRLLESSSLAHLSALYLGRLFAREVLLPVAARFGRSLMISCGAFDSRPHEPGASG